MKNILFLFFASVLVLASCNKEVTPLTKQEIIRRTDSITAARIKELDEMSQRDLQHRIKIEVKIKVDSILEAERKLQIKSDSIATAKSPAKSADTASRKNIISK